MEVNLLYLVKGELVSIPKEAGERTIRYFLRVKFITERLVDQYDYDTLLEYSCVLADSVLFGVDYPKHVTSQLKRMLNYEPLKVELDSIAEAILNGELYEDPIGLSVKQVNLSNILLSEKASLIATDHFKVDTSASSGLEPEQFEEIAHTGDLKELIDPIVEKVEYTMPEGDSQKAGISVTILDAAGTELVVQACGDQVCQNGGDVIFDNPSTGETTLIPAVPIEELIRVASATSSPQVVQQDVFKSVSDRNGFMMPDYSNILKCYAKALKPDIDDSLDASQLKAVIEGLEQDEIKLRSCILKSFTEDEAIGNKLKATRDKELIYAPQSESNWDIYWSDENRYGKLLMSVRTELVGGSASNISTADDNPSSPARSLREVVEDYIQTPTDVDRMSEIHTEIDEEFGQMDLFSDTIFTTLLNAYNTKMFSNTLTLEDVRYEIKWSDLTDIPAALNIDEVITMELSRSVFEKIDVSKEQLVFGVPCKTRLQCVQVFVESFIAGVLFEILKLPETVTCESLAESVFTHSDAEVSFAKQNVVEIAPACEVPQIVQASKKSALEIRNEILAMLNDGKKVTVKIPEGEFDVSSARSLTEIMLVVPEGNIPRKQPYDKITHVNSTPV